ncbi:MAG: hypothetical protein IJU62_06385 [Muribaculaceae bacterium]|nr:hypothetical protein [Muribaculaceae bacterium]
MPSINSLEMAAAISSRSDIIIKKSWFTTKAVYTPTQSVVKVHVLEYNPTEGSRLEHLLSLSPSKMAAELRQKGKPVPAAIGNYRLELCLSEDGRFGALQLFRFGDLRNNPICEPRFYAGEDVQCIAQIL